MSENSTGNEAGKGMLSVIVFTAGVIVLLILLKLFIL